MPRAETEEDANGGCSATLPACIRIVFILQDCRNANEPLIVHPRSPSLISIAAGIPFSPLWLSRATGNKSPTTYPAHRELLLNCFRARKKFSSGVIGVLNNKAKVTVRKPYGFRNFRVTY